MAKEAYSTLSMKLWGRHVSVQKQNDTVCPKLYSCRPHAPADTRKRQGCYR